MIYRECYDEFNRPATRKKAIINTCRLVWAADAVKSMQMASVIMGNDSIDVVDGLNDRLKAI